MRRFALAGKSRLILFRTEFASEDGSQLISLTAASTGAPAYRRLLMSPDLERAVFVEILSLVRLQVRFQVDDHFQRCVCHASEYVVMSYTMFHIQMDLNGWLIDRG